MERNKWRNNFERKKSGPSSQRSTKDVRRNIVCAQNWLSLECSSRKIRKTLNCSWYSMRWARNGIFEKILQISVEIAMECLGPIKCFLTDASSSKAPFANFGGKNPTDRAKQGIKKSLVIDYNRIILSVIVDAANVHDSKLLLPHAKMLCKFVSPKKAISMLADAAFDVEFLRRELVKHNIVLLASSNLRRSRNRTPYKSHGRWRIEQVFGILHWFRGIKTCWAKTKISFLAFCQFASAMHNFRCSGIFG